MPKKRDNGHKDNVQELHNSDVLTKKDLLRKVDQYEEVPIDLLGGKKVRIRPLSDGEWTRIEHARSDGMQMSIDNFDPDASEEDKQKMAENAKLNFDINKTYQAFYHADVLACVYGLEGNWKEAEVRQLRPVGIVEAIAKEVYRISGVDGESASAIKSLIEQ